MPMENFTLLQLHVRVVGIYIIKVQSFFKSTAGRLFKSNPIKTKLDQPVKLFANDACAVLSA